MKDKKDICNIYSEQIKYRLWLQCIEGISIIKKRKLIKESDKNLQIELKDEYIESETDTEKSSIGKNTSFMCSHVDSFIGENSPTIKFLFDHS